MRCWLRQRPVTISACGICSTGNKLWLRLGCSYFTAKRNFYVSAGLNRDKGIMGNVSPREVMVNQPTQPSVYNVQPYSSEMIYSSCTSSSCKLANEPVACVTFISRRSFQLITEHHKHRIKLNLNSSPGNESKITRGYAC